MLCRHWSPRTAYFSKASVDLHQPYTYITDMQQLPSVHIVYSTTTEEHLTENFTTHAVLGEEKKRKERKVPTSITMILMDMFIYHASS